MFRTTFHCFLFVLIFLTSNLLLAQPEADSTTEPYLKAYADGERIDNLPLLLTTVDTTISGIIADVTVTQYYKNDGEVPVEAIYVFPGSVNAAVYAFQMQVNDRVVIAEINEKQQARQIYEEAKEAGQTTSLLEQTGSAFFQTNVGNILPGDDIQVSLRYVETLIPDRGLYTFRFPIIRQTTEGATLPVDVHTSRPVRRTGDIAFDMIVELYAGLPIAEITSPSHQIDVSQPGPDTADIVLNPDDLYNNDKDFILQYRLAGDAIQTGLLTHEANDANYFLLMAQPPKQVTIDQVPAREYFFVVDVSGSMGGESMEIAKQAAGDLLRQLRDIDRFNVYLFAASSKRLARESVPATPDNIEDALDMLNLQQAGGGTNLEPVLRRIVDTPLRDGISRSTIVITDGGIAAGAETLQLIRDNLHNQNLFSLGTGNSQNEEIINGLASSGRGQSFSVTTLQDADTVVENLLRYISQPVLTDISIDYPAGLNVYDVIPKSIPDVFSERPVYVVGKWEGSWSGAVNVEGVSGGGIYSAGYLPEFTGDNDNTSAIRLLWAREQLREWEDDENLNGGLHKDTITQLGLDYSLVTQYTSFVAVDYEVRTEPEIAQEVAFANAPAPQQLQRAQTSGSRLRGIGMAADSLSGQLSLNEPLTPAQSLLAINAINQPPVLDTNQHNAVTFIMGDDEDADNPFYAAATAYFEHHPDESGAELITHLRTLSDVRQWLADNRSPGVWRKINIVAHGSAWTGLGVPITRDEIEDGSFPLELRFDPALALDESLISADTEIRLYGCGLGQSPRLLNQVAEFFGGLDNQRPAVYSPRDPLAFAAQHFDATTATVDYELLQHWSLIGNTQSPWTDDRLARELRQRYGDQQAWLEVLASPQTRLTVSPVTFSIKIPGLAHAPDKIPAWQLAARQPLLNRYSTETGMRVRDLDWEYRQQDGTISVVGTGWLYQIIAGQSPSNKADPFVVVRPANLPGDHYAQH